MNPEKVGLEVAVQCWKDVKINHCIMDFSCGGDEMQDVDFVFYGENENVLPSDTLNDFFKHEVFEKVDFYVNSGDEYIGEFGTVRIELNEEQADFEYTKSTTSEHSERITESFIYPIIKVLREETSGTYEYSYDSDLVLIKGNKEEFRIPIIDFKNKAIKLLSKLKETTDTTFSIPEIEDFIKSFQCISLKAKSTEKSDIRIVIHDLRTGAAPELGFSVKSQLGKPSTLFNSSKGSNFIYKVVGITLTSDEINSINNIETKSKIQDRVKELFKKNAKLKFITTEGSIFYNNLILIDSLLPQIMASIILQFNSSSKNKLVDLVNSVELENPLCYDVSNNHKYYSYKVKRLLTDIALGMLPTIVWDGKLDATGGYLVKKDNGEILCYHIYNRNEFEDYLLSNTKIINPSSTRLSFGKLYEDNGELFIKLNLQIRFIK